MTTEEFVERYCGTVPDVHRRKPFTTWDEIRDAMAEDLKQMISSACREQREICAAHYSHKSGIDFNVAVLGSIKNAPEPEFK